MKLYESAATPSCRRVSIFLKLIDADANAEIEREQIDLRSGDNLSEKFQQMSASGLVPVLEIDADTYLSESVAICRYLDGHFANNKGLFGRDLLEQAQVEMWHRIVELQGLFNAFQSFRHSTGFYADRENCVPEWGSEAKLRTEKFLDKLEARLAHSGFVACDHLTIADIAAFVLINVVKMALKIEIEDQYTHIQVWHNKLGAMPEFQ